MLVCEVSLEKKAPEKGIEILQAPPVGFELATLRKTPVPEQRVAKRNHVG